VSRSTRRREVQLDFRCRRGWSHDKRMALLWVDPRAPQVLCSRLPGGTALPDGWTAARLQCPACGLWATLPRDCAETVLIARLQHGLMAPFVWALWPSDRGCTLGASRRAVSGVSAGPSSTGPSSRRE
jgi:hypothetical protein